MYLRCKERLLVSECGRGFPGGFPRWIKQLSEEGAFLQKMRMAPVEASRALAAVAICHAALAFSTARLHTDMALPAGRAGRLPFSTRVAGKWPSTCLRQNLDRHNARGMKATVSNKEDVPMAPVTKKQTRSRFVVVRLLPNLAPFYSHASKRLPNSRTRCPLQDIRSLESTTPPLPHRTVTMAGYKASDLDRTWPSFVYSSAAERRSKVAEFARRVMEQSIAEQEVSTRPRALLHSLIRVCRSTSLCLNLSPSFA